MNEHAYLPSPAAQPEPALAALVGIDWADGKTAEGRREQGELDNPPEAVELWIAGLLQRFGHRPLAAALERATGPASGAILPGANRQREIAPRGDAAVRALAFQWIRNLYRSWKDRQPYREELYLPPGTQRLVPLRA